MINRKSMLMFLVLLLAVQLLACKMKINTLLNKTTTIPRDNAVYKNKTKFAVTLLQIVDTSVVYEEYNTGKNILMRSDPCIECRAYGVYKFYPNGCFNAFYLNRDKILSVTEFDPLYAGKRGVYYNENDMIRFDLFAEIDESQHIGKISGTLIFRGDTMYVKRNDRKGIDATEYPPRVFIKRKLPPEYFIYKANW